MPVLKVIEVLSNSPLSWEDAKNKAVETASNIFENICSVDVQDKSMVQNGDITEYRINAKIIFQAQA